MYTIAVANEKGGVAKTTTTLSLGAALRDGGWRVLLIDLDPQANLTLSLGLEPAKVEYTISNSLIDNESITKALRTTDFLGLDIVPANANLEKADQVLPATLGFSTRLRDVISEAEFTNYNVLLMDCPPSLGAITLNALTASDLLIIPTQAEYFSAYALRNMMSTIRQVRSDSNPNLAYRILITLLDQRNRTHRNIREQLERTFGEGLFRTIIEIDTKLRESPILGLPITQYKPNSRGAQQYLHLAEELMEYVQKTH